MRRDDGECETPDQPDQTLLQHQIRETVDTDSQTRDTDHQVADDVDDEDLDEER